MNNIDLKNKDMLRGILYIAGGIVLILYTFGYLQQSMDILLTIFALLLIVYGFFKSGLYSITQQLFKK